MSLGATLSKQIKQSGLNAFRVLGARNYAKYIVSLLANTPNIVYDRNVSSAGTWMNQDMELYFRGKTVRIPKIQEADRHHFGLIREIYLGDCYLKYHTEGFDKSLPILDLGGNRGIVSAYLGQITDHLIVVEPNRSFNSHIDAILKLNDVTKYEVINGFVGAYPGEMNNAISPATINLSEELRRRDIQRIGFAKIDIEGGEFALFEDMDFLSMLDHFSMEIHRFAGSPQSIMDAAKTAGFSLVCTDVALRPTTDPDRIDFIYGRKAPERS